MTPHDTLILCVAIPLTLAAIAAVATNVLPWLRRRQ